MRFLAARDYCVSGLAMKLQTKGYDPREVEQVLEELRQKGYIDQERYRNSTIRRLLKKHYSNWSIQKQLEQEGVSASSEQIDEMRNEIHLNTEEQIRQLIRKKTALVSLEKPKSEEKILRYLISRGHSYEQCRKGLAEFKKERN